MKLEGLALGGARHLSSGRPMSVATPIAATAAAA
jgi:hypothetical protein